MNVHDIEKLIDSFYEGNTSIEEEKLLLHYFRTANIPPHLLAEKAFFLKLAASEPEIPKKLEHKLSKLIDSWEKEEKKKFNTQRIRSLNWQWISGIAAVGLLLFYFWTNTEDNKPPSNTLQTDTFTNANDALKETQKALVLVSRNLNKGIEQVELANSHIKQANNIINQQFNKPSKR